MMPTIQGPKVIAKVRTRSVTPRKTTSSSRGGGTKRNSSAGVTLKMITATFAWFMGIIMKHCAHRAKRTNLVGGQMAATGVNSTISRMTYVRPSHERYPTPTARRPRRAYATMHPLINTTPPDPFGGPEGVVEEHEKKGDQEGDEVEQLPPVQAHEGVLARGWVDCP